jgi:hypothetical protein
LEYLGYARMAHSGYHALRTAHHHRHRFVVALAFLIPMITYALSVSHDVASRDLADAQSVPFLLGIMHPTGYPLWTMLGNLFSHILNVDSVAYRMNLFGALCMALTCVTGVVTALRIGIGPVTSLGAFLCFAWARIIWFHGAQADTQNLALLFQAMTLYYLCGWLIHARTRDIVAASAAFAAAIVAHPISLWLLPAFAFAKLSRAKNITVQNGGAGLMTFVLVLCCFAYLPLRSAAIEHHPVDATQMAAPAATRVAWDVNAPSTRQGFLAEITGAEFGTLPLWRSAVNPQNWLGYVKSLYATIHSSYDILFAVIIALGIIWLIQKRSKVCIMLLIAAASSTFVALAFAPLEGDPSRYLMLLLWIGALFAGGLSVGWNWTIDPRRIIWALILLANAVYIAIGSSSVAAQQRDATSRPIVIWLAQAIPDKAIVVAPWADATTLAYASYADHTFPGHTILAAKAGDLNAQYASLAKIEPVYVLSSTPLTDSRFKQVGTPEFGRTLYQFTAPGT